MWRDDGGVFHGESNQRNFVFGLGEGGDDWPWDLSDRTFHGFCRSLCLPIIVFLSLLAPLSAFAVEDLAPTMSARALGMGNAYVGVVDNIDSLFYNPASLAKVRGIQVRIASLDGAAEGLSEYSNVQKIESSSNLASTLPSLYGQNYYAGAQAMTGVAVPMFGAAIYDAVNTQFSIHSPPMTDINVNALNDFGYAMGVGVPIGPFVQVGIEGRYIKRSGTVNDYYGADLASLNTSQIKSDLTNWGRGYEFDMGANFLVPTPIFMLDLSVVWQNVGMTTYTQGPGNNIPADPANLTAGMAAEIRLPLMTIRPAIDYRHALEEDFQMWRRWNLGVEVSLPLISLRGGFSEGYYTYGAGVNLGPIRVDAASYGVELGDYPGQIEDRRYIAQLTIELDIFSFGVDDSRKDMGGSGSGKNGSAGANGSNGGDSSSVFGSGRLKERR